MKYCLKTQKNNQHLPQQNNNSNNNNNNLSMLSPLFVLVDLEPNDVTVKILKIGTPEIITIIVLQLEQLDFTVQYCVQEMQTE